MKIFLGLVEVCVELRPPDTNFFRLAWHAVSEQVNADEGVALASTLSFYVGAHLDWEFKKLTSAERQKS
jgi:hypothetical protein